MRHKKRPPWLSFVLFGVLGSFGVHIAINTLAWVLSLGADYGDLLETSVIFGSVSLITGLGGGMIARLFWSGCSRCAFVLMIIAPLLFTGTVVFFLPRNAPVLPLSQVWMVTVVGELMLAFILAALGRILLLVKMQIK